MNNSTEYYVVRQKALPEVLLKVVQAKRLLDSGKVLSVQEAVDRVGMSRSSFYKYKDEIFEFHDTTGGRSFTMTIQMEDEPGLLSDVLKIIAGHGANILTIHQSIPIGGIASLSISIQILSEAGDIQAVMEELTKHKGVVNAKIIAKE